jgi:fumarate hydratase subunit beta
LNSGLSFLGGSATLHTQSIQEVLQVGWSDMLMQYRLMRLRVEGLGPVTVAIDAHGNSNYADAQTNKQTNAQARIDQIMTFMDGARDQASTKKSSKD